jgi:hypothetical protein
LRGRRGQGVAVAHGLVGLVLGGLAAARVRVERLSQLDALGGDPTQ